MVGKISKKTSKTVCLAPKTNELFPNIYELLTNKTMPCNLAPNKFADRQDLSSLLSTSWWDGEKSVQIAQSEV